MLRVYFYFFLFCNYSRKKIPFLKPLGPNPGHTIGGDTRETFGKVLGKKNQEKLFQVF